MSSPQDRNNGSNSIKLRVSPPPQHSRNRDDLFVSSAVKTDGFTSKVEEEGNVASSTPSLVTGVHEKWNSPRINLWRTLAAILGLFVMGLNDAAYGALIPYLETYYNISYTKVSLIFLSPLVGYMGSAFLNSSIHMRFGQRGVAFLAPICRTTAYIVISQHPPYPVLVLFYILAGFGNGLEDGAWNAYIGNMHDANEILGFLHGAYGLGGVISPLVATTMITKGHLSWYTFYYLMIGISLIEFVAAVTAFWAVNGKKFRDEHPRTTDEAGGRTKEALKNRVVWICAVFLFIYVGIEVALGGWVVVFTMNIRHATPFAAGMSETGFWLGIMLGRVVLGFVTGRIGEKLAIIIYLGSATVLQLLFYLVPSLPLSYVAVALEGFFLGPMFPAAVIAATKLLPPHLHVGGIGFAAAFGAAGACVLPFAVGAIAQAKGVQVLMPIVLAMLVADVAVWAFLPRLRKGGWVEPEDEEKAGENRAVSNERVDGCTSNDEDKPG